MKINNYLSKFKEYFPERKISNSERDNQNTREFHLKDVKDLKINKTSMKGEVTIVISEKNLKRILIKMKLLTWQKNI